MGRTQQNLGEYESIETQWIALNVNGNYVKFFDSFGFEHIPKEIRKLIKNKNIIRNIYRIQAYDSVIYRYFCIAFMLKGKCLLAYTHLFLSDEYEKNDEIILQYFQ